MPTSTASPPGHPCAGSRVPAGPWACRSCCSLTTLNAEQQIAERRTAGIGKNILKSACNSERLIHTLDIETSGAPGIIDNSPVILGPAREYHNNFRMPGLGNGRERTPKILTRKEERGQPTYGHHNPNRPSILPLPGKLLGRATSSM